jgi:sugar-phosphatase
VGTGTLARPPSAARPLPVQRQQPCATTPVIEKSKMPIFLCSAILFDLDGVLVDSTRSVERHWRAWAQQKGLDPEKIMAIAHGVRALEVIQRVAPHLDAAAEVREIEAREVTDRDGVVPMAGAAALLASIPEEQWGVVTSGTRHLAGGRLRLMGLPVPKVLVTADDVANGKPHPEPYLKGAELLGVKPADCLVIEDAPAGIQSAQAGGMKVVGITSTYGADALAQADGVIAKLAAIQVAVNGAGKLTVEVR